MIKTPEKIKKLSPIFDYQVIAWQLTEKEARAVYPKYSDGITNFSEDEKMAFPDLDIENKPFLDLINDPIFNQIAIIRANELKIYQGQLLQNSITNSTEALIINARQDLGSENLCGHKYHIDYFNNIIYTLSDRLSFSSIERMDNPILEDAPILQYPKLKPMRNLKLSHPNLNLFDNQILLSFDLPSYATANNLSEILKLDINRFTDESQHQELIKEIRAILAYDYNLHTNSVVATVENIGNLKDEYLEYKINIGTKLLAVQPEHNFRIAQMYDIDWVKNKIYFITDFNATKLIAILND